MFSGLGMSMGNLSRLSSARSRSICAENPTGGKGMGAMSEADPNGPARDMGRGHKCRPCIMVQAGETVTLADIEGAGAIQSIWNTGALSRDMILRFYWDNAEKPSVECPVPDFFAVPWTFMPAGNALQGPLVTLNSLPVAVNPNRGMNCFWEMPFRTRCRITLENRGTTDAVYFYQINYTLTDVPEDCGYFHAQFRRTNPVPYGADYTIVDGIAGKGQYVGTSMGWGIHNNNWWGEGEIKFFMDGDGEFPTICGTGTEDYFGGAFDWDVDGKYIPYSTPYMGMNLIPPDGHYRSQHRHFMYRWHVADPVRFEQDLKVTMQVLGWRSEGRFLYGQHDICSVAYWYQDAPSENFPELPSRDELEII